MGPTRPPSHSRAALGASCEIYSDVPGVFTADPRIVPEARKLDVVSYEEMLEMGLGRKQYSCCEPSSSRETTMSQFMPAPRSRTNGHLGRGGRSDGAAADRVGGHARRGRVLFDLRGLPDRPGVAATIFEAVAAEHVNVDTILQNVGHESAELSFSVPQEDVSATRRALDQAQQSIDRSRSTKSRTSGRSLVGAGMRSHRESRRRCSARSRNRRSTCD